MGTTLLDVCNRALSRIGVARIGALTEATPAARAVSACFPSVPDWVLRSRKWRFAISRVALTNPEAAQGTAWTWRYTLPPDFFEVIPEDTHLDDVEFIIEANRLLCDLETPVWLRYVRQVTDPAQWDPAFAEVLSWKLALEIQPELAPGAVVATLLNEFDEALRGAHRSGAIEMAPSMGAAGDDWLSARI